MCSRLGIVLLLLLLCPYAAAEDEKALPPEAAEAFAWFDSLGYPDITKLPFVLVATGLRSYRIGEDPTNRFEHGFLLEDTGLRFRVLGIDLSTRSYAKKEGADVKPWNVRNYETLSLSVEVGRGLDRMKEFQKLSVHDRAWHREDKDPFHYQKYRPAMYFKLFVLARACAARGSTDLAGELWRLASKGGPKDQPFAKAIRSKIESEMRRNLFLDMENPEKSYADHHAAFVRLWRMFGYDEKEDGYIYRVIQELDAMAREEAVRTAKPEKEMSKAERIADLVYRLREPGAIWGLHPGQTDEDRPKSPGEQLVEIGFEAVPALLTALRDKRRARGITHYAGGGKGWMRPWFWVDRIADRVIRVLERVSGLSFFNNVITVELPPLRERRDDIPLLVHRFLDEIAEETQSAPKSLAEDALKALMNHHWPGNVRELRNEIQRAAALTDNVIVPMVLTASVRGHAEDNASVAELGQKPLREMVREVTEDLERKVIQEALRRSRGRKAQAARLLGVSRPTLDSKIDHYGLVVKRE